MHNLKQERVHRTRGFTLIEMIGVMAIIAILASAIVPNMIQSVMRARADQETLTLQTLADDLEHYIRINQHIPSPSTANWTQALSSVSDFPSKRLEYNENGYRRAIYFDPHFFTSTNSNFNGYTQQAGASTLVSPRLMIVSNLQANAPAAPTDHTAFSAIWDQTASASLKESATLKIERRNLRSLFHQVTLVNEWSFAPSYQLGSSSTHGVSNLPGTSIFVLENTRINLFDSADYSAGNLDHMVTVLARAQYNYRSNGSDGYWELP